MPVARHHVSMTALVAHLGHNPRQSTGMLRRLSEWHGMSGWRGNGGAVRDTGSTCRRTAIRPDGPRTPPAGASNPTEIVPVLGEDPEVELGQLP